MLESSLASLFRSPPPRTLRRRPLVQCHDGEVSEAQQGGGALAGAICRSQGCHCEELRRWHQGAPIRPRHRVRHCQVPAQGGIQIVFLNLIRERDADKISPSGLA